MSLSLKPGFRAGLGPVAPAHFQVTADAVIVRVPLDQFEQLLRPGQRGRRAESPVIFRQGVDVKRLAVDFFGIVHARVRVVQPPERAAVTAHPKSGS